MSSELLKLATNFSDIFDDFDIFCFYELLPWRFSSIVVSQDSAVIKGRLSEGLAVDHSGLNKYISNEDPNLVKIGDVVARMVRSAQTRFQNSGDVPQGASRKPSRHWELAASFAYNIERKFNATIKTLQARIAEQRYAETLLIQKYRFQSWAYAVGLITLLGARKPLHERLDGHVSENVCKLLDQVSWALDQVHCAKSTEGLTDDLQTMIASLQGLFQQLAALFPEKDGAILGHIFVSRVLQPDNDETTFESLVQNPILQSLPDVEAIAAMKRICLLIQKSEARRTSEDRLTIDMREMALDVVKSSLRTPGLFSRRELNMEISRQVLVEWKRYEGSWDTGVGNVLFRRVELLTDFLRTASKCSNVLNLRLLDCLGYCHDDAKQRLGFVMAIPPSVTDRRSYVRLNKLIKGYNDQRIYPPSVGDRMRLAKLLCKAMFDFHRAEWFHKSFSTYNILVFAEADASEEEESEALNLSQYSILAPYIVGFNYSRPSKPTEFSEPAKVSDELRRYWHPDYKNVPLQKYRHEYDYHSLGTVLLEIGLWTPLSTLMEGHIGFDRLGVAEFARVVRDSHCQKLGSLVGTIYQKAVIDLMEALEGERIDLDQNEPVPLGRLMQFQAEILETSEQCNA
ncbi:hypothetical protein LTR50_007760 [Elasticomyces elasticus]|nr:hypothetical protein LTR50_007760 [Elasticomyces elasticus]